jgi:4-aminobutyrate aminotransferase/(S)-3-amino-2-methylpropionate transaminase
MIAFDVLKSHGDEQPDGAAAKVVTAKALEGGLVVLSCGRYGETIRILVPLTASDDLVEEGLDILENALRDAAQ